MNRRWVAWLIGLGVVMGGCRSTPPPGDSPGDAAPSAPPIAPSAGTRSASPAASTPPSDVVAHASTMLEAGAKVLVTDSVDGAALRAKNRQRLARDRTPVTVLREDPGPEAAARL